MLIDLTPATGLKDDGQRNYSKKTKSPQKPGTSLKKGKAGGGMPGGSSSVARGLNSPPSEAQRLLAEQFNISPEKFAMLQSLMVDALSVNK
jgi:hypothetical protein